MDWLPFRHPADNFSPFVRWLEKNSGRTEGPLYNQRTLFRILSEKSFEIGEARSALLFQNVLSLFNGQNKSECHDFVSQTFLSHFTTDIFPQKLGTLFQKNFFCP